MNMNEIVILTEYRSDDKKLKSTVLKDNTSYRVDFYENEVYIGVRYAPNHSLYYAEDMALNYVEGVLKL